jgi:hypothetical protein
MVQGWQRKSSQKSRGRKVEFFPAFRDDKKWTESRGVAKGGIFWSARSVFGRPKESWSFPFFFADEKVKVWPRTPRKSFLSSVNFPHPNPSPAAASFSR